MDKIVNQFKVGQWLPADKVDCTFVKHSQFKASPGTFWYYGPDGSAVTLSVLIPTIDADRDGYFPKLLKQIGDQTLPKFEIIVVKGDSRQGRAINVAAALASGKYLLTLDDDTALPDKKTFEKLVEVMEMHPEIGIAGGNNIIPENANAFVKRVMKEIPRRSWQTVSEITISDLAEHPCMIMRAAEFKKIGGENELIYRGLDPYLREEFRKINKTVVVVPEVIYHHLPPQSAGKLFRQFFRNGLQAYMTHRYYPQWVIETPESHGSFIAYKTKLQRRLRFITMLAKSVITRKFVWLLCEISYAFGYVWASLKNKSYS